MIMVMKDMEKKINVIDLDSTLLPYNSLIHFVLLFMKNRRCFLPLLFYLEQRITGKITKEEYLKKILITARKTTQYEKKVKKFGLSLYDDIRKPMLRFIFENTDEFTINILCTASPEDYAKYLCEKLGWTYICSTLENNDENFVHMFGHNKVIAVQKMYPKQNYTYHLAMSDNISDRELLKLFDKSYHIKNGKKVRVRSTK
jgi:phosphoserine phosphatase